MAPPRETETDTRTVTMRKDMVVTVLVAALFGAFVTFLTLWALPSLDPNANFSRPDLVMLDRTVEGKREGVGGGERVGENESKVARVEVEKEDEKEIPAGSAWEAKLNGTLVCNKGVDVTSPAGSGLDKAPGFFITDKNLEHILACLCNENRQIIFTTFSIMEDGSGNLTDDDPALGMTAFNYNWVKHMENAGVDNYLLIGLSNIACAPSRALGIPCYVNTFKYMENVEVDKGTVVVLKWYYLYKMIQKGYNAIFLDNDVAVKKNPFVHWNMSFDFQGLSDAQPGDGMQPKLLKDAPCMYFYGAPCMSTGIMFVRATEPSLDVLKSMVARMQEERGWEQAVFQDQVQSFQIYVENSRRALRFRILPMANYHNVGMLDARMLHDNPVDTVMAHCGYVHGSVAKRDVLKSHGFWIHRPDVEE